MIVYGHNILRCYLYQELHWIACSKIHQNICKNILGININKTGLYHSDKNGINLEDSESLLNFEVSVLNYYMNYVDSKVSPNISFDAYISLNPFKRREYRFNSDSENLEQYRNLLINEIIEHIQRNNQFNSSEQAIRTFNDTPKAIPSSNIFNPIIAKEKMGFTTNSQETMKEYPNNRITTKEIQQDVDMSSDLEESRKNSTTLDMGTQDQIKQSSVKSNNSENSSKSQMLQIQKFGVHEPSFVKEKIPFLKDFKFKPIKRENLDKKVLRNFRKFLKKLMSNNMIEEEILVYDNEFWTDFLRTNLLPPMIYKTKNEVVEFKSFNTSYMYWLFYHKYSTDLYNKFIDEKSDFIKETIIDPCNVDKSEIEWMLFYVKRMGTIYSKHHQVFYVTNEKSTPDTDICIDCNTDGLQSTSDIK